jgi:hypothetical protein
MTFTGHTAGGTTVLLFGPQSLSFSTDSFQRLRAALNDNPDNAWMNKIVDELPNCTKRASEQFPKLEATPAATLQDSLKDWLKSDVNTMPTGSENLPNAVLTPLVVLYVTSVHEMQV